MSFVPQCGGFRINAQTGGDEFAPDVAALSNGGFVFVWKLPDEEAGAHA